MAEKNKGQKPPLTMKQMEAGFGGKQIKETVKQSKSLSELVDTMKSQSKNVTEQVSATVDVEKSLKGLEGFMGINSTEDSSITRTV